MTDLSFVDRADGLQLARRFRPGRGPTLLFLPGYASDMDGAKALALDSFAADRGVAILRFDYSGTGKSQGNFTDGTLEQWLDEALLMADRSSGPLIAVGSSMGGWIALHLALRRPARVAGIVGIAAAPDFTDWGYSVEQKKELEHAGRLVRANPYGGDSQLTTFEFWRSGQSLRLLETSIDIDCPVRLVHGDADEDVPVEVALKTMRMLRSADVQLTLVKRGGHRLSERHEIATILRTVAALLEEHQ